MSKHFACLLCAFAALLLISFALKPLDSSRESDDHFAVSESIVDVILRDYNDGTLHYDCIGPNQTRQEAEVFQSDPVKIYKADHGCFSLENEILQIRLMDESGNEVEVTPEIQNIFRCASELDHAVLDLYILEHENGLFPIIELNVNLWWPCRLYYYNPSTAQLTNLYTYDATEIIGLRVRYPENIPT